MSSLPVPIVIPIQHVMQVSSGGAPLATDLFEIPLTARRTNKSQVVETLQLQQCQDSLTGPVRSGPEPDRPHRTPRTIDWARVCAERGIHFGGAVGCRTLWAIVGVLDSHWNDDSSQKGGR